MRNCTARNLWLLENGNRPVDDLLREYNSIFEPQQTETSLSRIILRLARQEVEADPFDTEQLSQLDSLQEKSDAEATFIMNQVFPNVHRTILGISWQRKQPISSPGVRRSARLSRPIIDRSQRRRVRRQRRSARRDWIIQQRKTDHLPAENARLRNELRRYNWKSIASTYEKRGALDKITADGPTQSAMAEAVQTESGPAESTLTESAPEGAPQQSVPVEGARESSPTESSPTVNPPEVSAQAESVPAESAPESALESTPAESGQIETPPTMAASGEAPTGLRTSSSDIPADPATVRNKAPSVSPIGAMPGSRISKWRCPKALMHQGLLLAKREICFQFTCWFRNTANAAR